MNSIDITIFIKPELLIVVAILAFIGTILKKIKKIPDELIPIALSVSGMIIVCLIKGFNIDAVLQGIIAAACAVYGNQVTKQVNKLNTTAEGVDINNTNEEALTYHRVDDDQTH